MILLHFKHIFVYFMVLLCAIYAVDSVTDGTRYERMSRRLLPYEEHEFSFPGSLRRAPKREIKLRTAAGFGKRDDMRNLVGFGKRDESKIKKLQRGMLRTAIGFGKRSSMFRTPESDTSVLQRLPQKEDYPLDWYYEDTTENDSDPLLKFIRKFREMKRNANDETNADPERAYSYDSRFTSRSSNLDD